MESLKVKDLVQNQIAPVILSAKDTVAKAVEVLAKHNITSAPVIKEPEREQIGFIDTLDLMSFLCYVSTKEEKKRTSGPSFALETDDYELSFQRNLDFNLEKIEALIDASAARNPMYTVDTEDSVIKAVDYFKRGVHRVSVTKNGEESHILTQSSVITYLANHLSEVVSEKKANLTMLELGLVDTTRTVGSVSKGSKARDCFQYMAEHQISSVAIVDEDNEVVSQISASDLKGIGKYQFADLLLNVEKFLEKNGKNKNKLISLTASATVAEAIKLLASNKIHRAIIVDDKKQLKGIVGMTDLLRAVFN